MTSATPEGMIFCSMNYLPVSGGTHPSITTREIKLGGSARLLVWVALTSLPKTLIAMEDLHHEAWVRIRPLHISEYFHDYSENSDRIDFVIENLSMHEFRLGLIQF